MDEHASVFYSPDLQCYLLCYDSDLENLPSPSLSRLPGGLKLAPYRIKQYRTDSVTPKYAMRIVYKPETTDRGKAPDGSVDLYCVVSHDWLNKMMLQYESVFPAGLPDEQLLTLTQCEILDV